MIDLGFRIDLGFNSNSDSKLYSLVERQDREVEAELYSKLRFFMDAVSDLSMHLNHLKGMLKPRLPGCRVPYSVWKGIPKFPFLRSSQVMLLQLIQGPHSENHCLLIAIEQFSDDPSLQAEVEINISKRTPSPKFNHRIRSNNELRKIIMHERVHATMSICREREKNSGPSRTLHIFIVRRKYRTIVHETLT